MIGNIKPDTSNLDLGFYFNNKFERRSRHIDTYLPDNPDTIQDPQKTKELQDRNIYSLITDLSKQIQGLSNFLQLENKDDIWNLIDVVYPELELYNMLHNIDNYIKLTYYTAIDNSRFM